MTHTDRALQIDDSERDKDEYGCRPYRRINDHMDDDLMLHLPKSMTATLAIFCYFLLAIPRAGAQEIRWTRSPQAAVDSAQQSGKMILVSVGAEWCHYCKKMDKEVWTNHSLVRVIQDNYVPLKLSEKQHKELVQALQIQAYPTTLVFTSDRRLVARLEGFVGAKKMLDALNRIQVVVRERKIAAR